MFSDSSTTTFTDKETEQKHSTDEAGDLPPYKPLRPTHIDIKEAYTKKNESSASFLRAARAGNLDKVKEHLKSGIDINTCNANGLNALHLASKEGHANVVDELLSRGVEVNSATKKGNTALHIASLAGQLEIVKMLTQHGADVNVQSQNGFTPLYMAAQENHDSIVVFLIDNGANQSLSTEDGFTPLAVALQQGHDKVVAILLENDTRSKIRLPALHIAAKKDDTKAANLLLQSDHHPDVTSKSGFTPLHIAAHYGNENVAQLLLERGANVNFQARHDITPLHVASKWGRPGMCSSLIAHGATIDCKTKDLLTPLHCAARSGHDKVVELLLEKEAPVLVKTKNGLTPLHMAAQGDHVDTVRVLVNNRAPVDEVTADFLTPLHVAAHCGHVRVAKLLLDNKANPDSRALNGFTPLHVACKKNRIKVVELLLKYMASIEATTESGLTPLHVAAFMGCMNIVSYLLQNGCKTEVVTVRGETPLHLACRANQIDVIRVLLRNGANVDAKARESQTPLHIASRLGNTDVVMLLLQHGAQVGNATRDSYTPLHVAAKENQEEVATLLLEHGAPLNVQTSKGFTPLHLAAKYGHLSLAKHLLDHGADPNVQGKNLVTPLHVASHYNHENVASLLLERGASPKAVAKNGYTPLHIAAKKNQMDIAATLIEFKAEINAESKAGFTPLHLAAQEGHVQMTSLLIENGARVNCAAKNGLTPMHLCAQEDKVQTATVLADHRANIDAQTKAGYTPLHVACHFGQANMVKFLLQRRARTDLNTDLGYSPLHQAAQHGHSVVVNLLLENGAQPNALTKSGQTPLSIAEKLGYVGLVLTLKPVTDSGLGSHIPPEEAYAVHAPETMQETFMSESEDELEPSGSGEYQEEMIKSTLLDHEDQPSGLPMEKSMENEFVKVVHARHVGKGPSVIASGTISDIDETVSSSIKEPARREEVDLGIVPVLTGNGPGASSPMANLKRFLISFMVDARGGAMRGCRHSGVRIIVPPRKASMPLRVTCRYLRQEKLVHPPPMTEGEGLASRVLEMGPAGARFLGPVIIEVPHFASLRGREREIVILRSDDGEHWKEHQLEATEDAVQDVLNESFDAEELSQLEDLNTTRITRILTSDFPQFFAIISRYRQEVHAVSPEGGVISSTVFPQVQALFPEGSLTKTIRVGLQANAVPQEIITKMFGNRVITSPIVTVEPRRRKFHKPITLVIPLPQSTKQGAFSEHPTSSATGGAPGQEMPTLRLLCSITGGTSPAQWEDITGTTQLTFSNDTVSFTTTVSARFWLMDCQMPRDAARIGQEIYSEASIVPYMAKFVIFARRANPTEGQLRVFCMTDDKEDKTLEREEHYAEIAKSRDVEVLAHRQQFLEFSGNLLPVTKTGEQLSLKFSPFQENRLMFLMRLRDVTDPDAAASGRIAFMREPKTKAGFLPTQQPICSLAITLPEYTGREIWRDTTIITLERRYRRLRVPGHDVIYGTDIRVVDLAHEMGPMFDWSSLARSLDIPPEEIDQIREEYPGSELCTVLLIWLEREGPQATRENLARALSRTGHQEIADRFLTFQAQLELEKPSPASRFREMGRVSLPRIVRTELIAQEGKPSEREEFVYRPASPELQQEYIVEPYILSYEPSPQEITEEPKPRPVELRQEELIRAEVPSPSITPEPLKAKELIVSEEDEARLLMKEPERIGAREIITTEKQFVSPVKAGEPIVLFEEHIYEKVVEEHEKVPEPGKVVLTAGRLKLLDEGTIPLEAVREIQAKLEPAAPVSPVKELSIRPLDITEEHAIQQEPQHVIATGAPEYAIISETTKIRKGFREEIEEPERLKQPEPEYFAVQAEPIKVSELQLESENLELVEEKVEEGLEPRQIIREIREEMLITQPAAEEAEAVEVRPEPIEIRPLEFTEERIIQQKESVPIPEPKEPVELKSAVAQIPEISTYLTEIREVDQLSAYYLSHGPFEVGTLEYPYDNLIPEEVEFTEVLEPYMPIIPVSTPVQPGIRSLEITEDRLIPEEPAKITAALTADLSELGRPEIVQVEEEPFLAPSPEPLMVRSLDMTVENLLSEEPTVIVRSDSLEKYELLREELVRPTAELVAATLPAVEERKILDEAFRAPEHLQEFGLALTPENVIEEEPREAIIKTRAELIQEPVETLEKAVGKEYEPEIEVIDQLTAHYLAAGPFEVELLSHIEENLTPDACPEILPESRPSEELLVREGLVEATIDIRPESEYEPEVKEIDQLTAYYLSSGPFQVGSLVKNEENLIPDACPEILPEIQPLAQVLLPEAIPEPEERVIDQLTAYYLASGPFGVGHLIRDEENLIPYACPKILPEIVPSEKALVTEAFAEAGLAVDKTYEPEVKVIDQVTAYYLASGPFQVGELSKTEGHLIPDACPEILPEILPSEHPLVPEAFPGAALLPAKPEFEVLEEVGGLEAEIERITPEPLKAASLFQEAELREIRPAALISEEKVEDNRLITERQIELPGIAAETYEPEVKEIDQLTAHYLAAGPLQVSELTKTEEHLISGACPEILPGIIPSEYALVPEALTGAALLPAKPELEEMKEVEGLEAEKERVTPEPLKAAALFQEAELREIRPAALISEEKVEDYRLITEGQVELPGITAETYEPEVKEIDQLTANYLAAGPLQVSELTKTEEHLISGACPEILPGIIPSEYALVPEALTAAALLPAKPEFEEMKEVEGLETEKERVTPEPLKAASLFQEAELREIRPAEFIGGEKVEDHRLITERKIELPGVAAEEHETQEVFDFAELPSPEPIGVAPLLFTESHLLQQEPEEIEGAEKVSTVAQIPEISEHVTPVEEIFEAAELPSPEPIGVAPFLYTESHLIWPEPVKIEVVEKSSAVSQIPEISVYEPEEIEVDELTAYYLSHGPFQAEQLDKISDNLTPGACPEFCHKLHPEQELISEFAPVAPVAEIEEKVVGEVEEAKWEQPEVPEPAEPFRAEEIFKDEEMPEIQHVERVYDKEWTETQLVTVCQIEQAVEPQREEAAALSQAQPLEIESLAYTEEHLLPEEPSAKEELIGELATPIVEEIPVISAGPEMAPKEPESLIVEELLRDTEGLRQIEPADLIGEEKIVEYRLTTVEPVGVVEAMAPPRPPEGVEGEKEEIRPEAIAHVEPEPLKVSELLSEEEGVRLVDREALLTVMAEYLAAQPAETLSVETLPYTHENLVQIEIPKKVEKKEFVEAVEAVAQMPEISTYELEKPDVDALTAHYLSLGPYEPKQLHKLNENLTADGFPQPYEKLVAEHELVPEKRAQLEISPVEISELEAEVVPEKLVEEYQIVSEYKIEPTTAPETEAVAEYPPPSPEKLAVEPLSYLPSNLFAEEPYIIDEKRETVEKIAAVAQMPDISAYEPEVAEVDQLTAHYFAQGVLEVQQLNRTAENLIAEGFPEVHYDKLQIERELVPETQPELRVSAVPEEKRAEEEIVHEAPIPIMIQSLEIIEEHMVPESPKIAGMRPLDEHITPEPLREGYLEISQDHLPPTEPTEVIHKEYVDYTLAREQYPSEELQLLTGAEELKMAVEPELEPITQIPEVLKISELGLTPENVIQEEPVVTLKELAEYAVIQERLELDEKGLEEATAPVVSELEQAISPPEPIRIVELGRMPENLVQEEPSEVPTLKGLAELMTMKERVEEMRADEITKTAEPASEQIILSPEPLQISELGITPENVVQEDYEPLFEVTQKRMEELKEPEQLKAGVLLISEEGISTIEFSEKVPPVDTGAFELAPEPFELTIPANEIGQPETVVREFVIPAVEPVQLQPSSLTFLEENVIQIPTSVDLIPAVLPSEVEEVAVEVEEYAPVIEVAGRKADEFERTPSIMEGVLLTPAEGTVVQEPPEEIAAIEAMVSAMVPEKITREFLVSEPAQEVAERHDLTEISPPQPLEIGALGVEQEKLRHFESVEERKVIEALPAEPIKIGVLGIEEEKLRQIEIPEPVLEETTVQAKTPKPLLETSLLLTVENLTAITPVEIKPTPVVREELEEITVTKEYEFKDEAEVEGRFEDVPYVRAGEITAHELKLTKERVSQIEPAGFVSEAGRDAAVPTYEEISPVDRVAAFKEEQVKELSLVGEHAIFAEPEQLAIGTLTISDEHLIPIGEADGTAMIISGILSDEAVALADEAISFAHDEYKFEEEPISPSESLAVGRLDFTPEHMFELKREPALEVPAESAVISEMPEALPPTEISKEAIMAAAMLIEPAPVSPINAETLGYIESQLHEEEPEVREIVEKTSIFTQPPKISVSEPEVSEVDQLTAYYMSQGPFQVEQLEKTIDTTLPSAYPIVHEKLEPEHPLVADFEMKAKPEPSEEYAPKPAPVIESAAELYAQPEPLSVRGLALTEEGVQQAEPKFAAAVPPYVSKPEVPQITEAVEETIISEASLGEAELPAKVPAAPVSIETLRTTESKISDEPEESYFEEYYEVYVPTKGQAEPEVEKTVRLSFDEGKIAQIESEKLPPEVVSGEYRLVTETPAKKAIDDKVVPEDSHFEEYYEVYEPAKRKVEPEVEKILPLEQTRLSFEEEKLTPIEPVKLSSEVVSGEFRLVTETPMKKPTEEKDVPEEAYSEDYYEVYEGAKKQFEPEVEKTLPLEQTRLSLEEENIAQIEAEARKLYAPELTQLEVHRLELVPTEGYLTEIETHKLPTKHLPEKSLLISKQVVDELAAAQAELTTAEQRHLVEAVVPVSPIAIGSLHVEKDATFEIEPQFAPIHVEPIELAQLVPTGELPQMIRSEERIYYTQPEAEYVVPPLEATALHKDEDLPDIEQYVASIERIIAPEIAIVTQTGLEPKTLKKEPELTQLYHGATVDQELQGIGFATAEIRLSKEVGEEISGVFEGGALSKTLTEMEPLVSEPFEPGVLPKQEDLLPIEESIPAFQMKPLTEFTTLPSEPPKTIDLPKQTELLEVSMEQEPMVPRQELSPITRTEIHTHIEQQPEEYSVHTSEDRRIQYEIFIEEKRKSESHERPGFGLTFETTVLRPEAELPDLEQTCPSTAGLFTESVKALVSPADATTAKYETTTVVQYRPEGLLPSSHQTSTLVKESELTPFKDQTDIITTKETESGMETTSVFVIPLEAGILRKADELREIKEPEKEYKACPSPVMKRKDYKLVDINQISDEEQQQSGMISAQEKLAHEMIPDAGLQYGTSSVQGKLAHEAIPDESLEPGTIISAEGKLAHEVISDESLESMKISAEEMLAHEIIPDTRSESPTISVQVNHETVPGESLEFGTQPDESLEHGKIISVEGKLSHEIIRDIGSESPTFSVQVYREAIPVECLEFEAKGNVAREAIPDYTSESGTVSAGRKLAHEAISGESFESGKTSAREKLALADAGLEPSTISVQVYHDVIPGEGGLESGAIPAKGKPTREVVTDKSLESGTIFDKGKPAYEAISDESSESETIPAKGKPAQEAISGESLESATISAKGKLVHQIILDESVEASKQSQLIQRTTPIIKIEPTSLSQIDTGLTDFIFKPKHSLSSISEECTSGSAVISSASSIGADRTFTFSPDFMKESESDRRTGGSPEPRPPDSLDQSTKSTVLLIRSPSSVEETTLHIGSSLAGFEQIVPQISDSSPDHRFDDDTSFHALAVEQARKPDETVQIELPPWGNSMTRIATQVVQQEPSPIVTTRTEVCEVQRTIDSQVTPHTRFVEIRERKLNDRGGFVEEVDKRVTSSVEPITTLNLSITKPDQEYSTIVTVRKPSTHSTERSWNGSQESTSTRYGAPEADFDRVQSQWEQSRSTYTLNLHITRPAQTAHTTCRILTDDNFEEKPAEMSAVWQRPAQTITRFEVSDSEDSAKFEGLLEALCKRLADEAIQNAISSILAEDRQHFESREFDSTRESPVERTKAHDLTAEGSSRYILPYPPLTTALEDVIAGVVLETPHELELENYQEMPLVEGIYPPKSYHVRKELDDVQSSTIIPQIDEFALKDLKLDVSSLQEEAVPSQKDRFETEHIDVTSQQIEVFEPDADIAKGLLISPTDAHVDLTQADADYLSSSDTEKFDKIRRESTTSSDEQIMESYEEIDKRLFIEATQVVKAKTELVTRLIKKDVDATGISMESLAELPITSVIPVDEVHKPVIVASEKQVHIEETPEKSFTETRETVIKKGHYVMQETTDAPPDFTELIKKMVSKAEGMVETEETDDVSHREEDIAMESEKHTDVNKDGCQQMDHSLCILKIEPSSLTEYPAKVEDPMEDERIKDRSHERDPSLLNNIDDAMRNERREPLPENKFESEAYPVSTLALSTFASSLSQIASDIIDYDESAFCEVKAYDQKYIKSTDLPGSTIPPPVHDAEMEGRRNAEQDYTLFISATSTDKHISQEIEVAEKEEPVTTFPEAMLSRLASEFTDEILQDAMFTDTGDALNKIEQFRAENILSYDIIQPTFDKELPATGSSADSGTVKIEDVSFIPISSLTPSPDTADSAGSIQSNEMGLDIEASNLVNDALSECGIAVYEEIAASIMHDRRLLDSEAEIEGEKLISESGACLLLQNQIDLVISKSNEGTPDITLSEKTKHADNKAETINLQWETTIQELETSQEESAVIPPTEGFSVEGLEAANKGTPESDLYLQAGTKTQADMSSVSDLQSDRIAIIATQAICKFDTFETMAEPSDELSTDSDSIKQIERPCSPLKDSSEDMIHDEQNAMQIGILSCQGDSIIELSDSHSLLTQPSTSASKVEKLLKHDSVDSLDHLLHKSVDADFISQRHSADSLDEISLKSSDSLRQRGKRYSLSRRSSTCSQKSLQDDAFFFTERLTPELKVRWSPIEKLDTPDKIYQALSDTRSSASVSDKSSLQLTSPTRDQKFEFDFGRELSESPTNRETYITADQADQSAECTVLQAFERQNIPSAIKPFSKHSSLSNISESSLQEFERIETELTGKNNSSPGSSEVDIAFIHRRRASNGSQNSLSEFEKLERECTTETQSTMTSVDGEEIEKVDVMLLSDIKEESESEDMSVKDDGEEPMPDNFQKIDLSLEVFPVESNGASVHSDEQLLTPTNVGFKESPYEQIEMGSAEIVQESNVRQSANLSDVIIASTDDIEPCKPGFPIFESDSLEEICEESVKPVTKSDEVQSDLKFTESALIEQESCTESYMQRSGSSDYNLCSPSNKLASDAFDKDSVLASSLSQMSCDETELNLSTSESQEPLSQEGFEQVFSGDTLRSFQEYEEISEQDFANIPTDTEVSKELLTPVASSSHFFEKCDTENWVDFGRLHDSLIKDSASCIGSGPGYSFTRTTLQSVQPQTDGAINVIRQTVTTRIIDPVIETIRITGPPVANSVQMASADIISPCDIQEYESTDEFGNVTSTIIKHINERELHGSLLRSSLSSLPLESFHSGEFFPIHTLKHE